MKVLGVFLIALGSAFIIVAGLAWLMFWLAQRVIGKPDEPQEGGYWASHTDDEEPKDEI